MCILSAKLKKLLNFRLLSSNKGLALLEFAFCIPVLIGLIYLAYDLPRVKHLKNQGKADISYATILLKHMRDPSSDNPKVTIDDILHVMEALAISHGYTTDSPSNYNYKGFGYNIVCTASLIKGTKHNAFRWLWSQTFIFERVSGRSFSSSSNGKFFSKFSSLFNSGNDSNDITDILSDAEIQEDEYKMVLEIGYNNYDNHDVLPSDTSKASFGFVFMEPRKASLYSQIIMKRVAVFEVDSRNYNETAPTWDSE